MDTIEDLRNSCKIILLKTLKNKKKVNMIENLIYNFSIKNNECCLESIYKDTLFEIMFKIKRNYNITDIISNLKNGEIAWESHDFDQIRFKQKEEDDFIVTPFEVDEGVVECRKCGSKKTFSYQRQDRACDESATTYSQCMNCKSKWSYSG